MMGRVVAGLVAGLVVCSCGGGGGGGSGSASVAVVPGGPIPTPAATGSPTPPVAIYPTYAELSGDQSFRTSCAGIRLDTTPSLATSVTPFGAGLTLGYTSATQTYLATSDPTLPFFVAPRSYGPPERDPAAPAGVAGFVRVTNGFMERFSIGTPLASGTTATYARGLSLRVPVNAGGVSMTSPAIQYMCIFGVPTRLDDQPRTTQVSFTRTGFNGVAYLTGGPVNGPLDSYSLANSQVTFRVDLATYMVTTTVRLVGVLQTANGPAATTTDLGTYMSSIQIDERGFYNGLLSSTDRQVSFASFGGWFFGPQGAEAAFTVSVNATDPTTGRRISAMGNAIALR